MRRPRLAQTTAILVAAVLAGSAVVVSDGGSGAVRAQQVETKKAAPSANGRPAAAVTFSVKVYDASGNVFLQGERTFPAKTDAFDALRDMVNVEYKTFVDLGVFVTGLGGVHPPEGSFWALYVDGKLSDKGISNISLTEDKRIEWKIEKPMPR